MKRSVPLVVLAACGLCASWSAAHPNPALVKSMRAAKQPAGVARRQVVLNHTDGAFTENFDSYANGSGIIGQGPWQGWSGTTPAPDGFVSNEQASSGVHSLRMNPVAPQTDVVVTHNITGGKWEYGAKTYMPSSSIGTGYFIILNTYPTFDWSLDMAMNASTNVVNTLEVGAVNNQVPLVRDQWVDIRCEIDLDAAPDGLLDVYYNNQLVTSDIPWNVGGAHTLQALDLYADTNTKFFYDDVYLEPMAAPCYPDCNNDLVLNLGDFGCFQTKFALNDPYADCNGDLVLNLGDFGCFQTKFALGCP